MSGPTPLASTPASAPVAVVTNNPLAARPTQSEAVVGGWGRLVSINRNGSDGTTYHLSGAWMDVGKGAVDISVAEDPYLAYRHARFAKHDNGIVVTPLDNFNGVLRRIDAEVPLVHEDTILVGREVC
jgi:hypothetical protein